MSERPPRDCEYTAPEIYSQEAIIIHFSELCYKAFELGLTSEELKDQVDICLSVDLDDLSKQVSNNDS